MKPGPVIIAERKILALDTGVSGGRCSGNMAQNAESRFNGINFKLFSKAIIHAAVRQPFAKNVSLNLFVS
jgi:hypothetical protein